MLSYAVEAAGDGGDGLQTFMLEEVNAAKDHAGLLLTVLFSLGEGHAKEFDPAAVRGDEVQDGF